MKDPLLDDPSPAQMLDHDPLEKRRGDPVIPDPFRVHHDDRSALADPKAGRLTALHPPRSEQQPFPLEQRRQQPVELATTVVGRTVSADTHENVMRVGFHPG